MVTCDITTMQLDTVEDWLAGDTRELRFSVEDEYGNPVDLSEATITWALFEREYQADPSVALLSQDDDGVSIETNGSDGAFRVEIDGDASTDLYGQYFHRPIVDRDDGVASWIGEVIVTASL